MPSLCGPGAGRVPPPGPVSSRPLHLHFLWSVWNRSPPPATRAPLNKREGTDVTAAIGSDHSTTRLQSVLLGQRRVQRKDFGILKSLLPRQNISLGANKAKHCPRGALPSDSPVKHRRRGGARTELLTRGAAWPQGHKDAACVGQRDVTPGWERTDPIPGEEGEGTPGGESGNSERADGGAPALAAHGRAAQSGRSERPKTRESCSGPGRQL